MPCTANIWPLDLCGQPEAGISVLVRFRRHIGNSIQGTTEQENIQASRVGKGARKAGVGNLAGRRKPRRRVGFVSDWSRSSGLIGLLSDPQDAELPGKTHGSARQTESDAANNFRTKSIHGICLTLGLARYSMRESESWGIPYRPGKFKFTPSKNRRPVHFKEVSTLLVSSKPKS